MHHIPHKQPRKISHIKTCQPIYPQLAYLHTQTQLYKFNISSPNRDPCVAISQWSMHNASPCCVRVRFSAISMYNIDTRLLFTLVTKSMTWVEAIQGLCLSRDGGSFHVYYMANEIEFIVKLYSQINVNNYFLYKTCLHGKRYLTD